MKSLFKLSFLALMAIMTAFVACNKVENGVPPENVVVKTTENPQSLSAKVTQIYRLDGTDVPKGTFPLDDPSYYIVLEQQSDVLLVINGFTSKESYFLYGDSHNLDLRRGQIIEEHLATYAESSGAIAEQEATGQIPKWWNKYVEDYISLVPNCVLLIPC
jgi:hypothetical protein